MREMKDSGIPWIGEIPSHWRTSSLKHFIDCFDGKRVPVDASLRRKGQYPYWGAGNIVDYVDDFLFDEELVLLGEDGAPFFDKTRPVAFYVNEKVWINNHIHVLKAHKNIAARYLVHYLNAVDYTSYINGSILPKLTQGNMNTIQLLLPPLAEQKLIADYLDRKCGEIDELVVLQEKMIEELKSYKQSVITEAVTKGLNPNAPMKDSGIEWIGEIPEGWEMSKIKNEVFILDNLRQPISAENRENKLGLYDYYGASGVIDKIDDFNVEDKVLLIAEDGANLLLRHLPLIYKAEGRFWVNNHAHILKVKESNDYNFMSYLLEAGDYTLYITGSAQPKLSQDNVKNFLIPIPRSLSEQQAIADYLDEKCAEIDSLIALKQQKIEHLKEYKKSLIYEYVTGKKQVASADGNALPSA